MDTVIKPAQADITFEAPATKGALVAPEQSAAPARRAKQPTSILQLIAQAARDPRVDIDKMERLIAMQKDMQAQTAELEYDNAMAAAQEEMEPIRSDLKNKQTSSKYASMSALDRAIRPIYTKHGFSLSFTAAEGAPAEHVRVVCRVAHRGGHRERPYIDMPSDGKGAKGADVMTKTHATGSAVTYGRRYLKQMIFDLAVEHDDDGNAAGHKPGAPGSAGGGGQFRNERRSSWGPGGKEGALEEAERDGLTAGARAKPLPGADSARGSDTTLTPEQQRAAKVKAAVDKRVDALKAGAPWLLAELHQFWTDNDEWIDWMSDKANGVLDEYERFTKAYAAAERTVKETR